MQMKSGGRCVPVPMIPTPSTPPRLGMAEMKAVTVGKRSLGNPAWGMTIVTIVPYKARQHHRH